MNLRFSIPLAATAFLAAFSFAGAGNDPIVGGWAGSCDYVSIGYTNGVPTETTTDSEEWSVACLSNHSASVVGFPGKWSKSGKKYTVDSSASVAMAIQGIYGDPNGKGKLKLKNVKVDPVVGLIGDVKHSFSFHDQGDTKKVKMTAVFACAAQ